MSETRLWPRPQVIPLPDAVYGEEAPRVCLNGGGWRVNLNPDPNFFATTADLSGWEETTVPLQLPTPEHEYAYVRDVAIPADWKGRRALIRFDGVNCLCRVFVDGKFVRDHYGGFVSWDCDITDFVTPGKACRLALGVTDAQGGVNPFHTGGVIRDVTLLALPKVYLSRLHADTEFDKAYSDATLTVHAALAGGDGAVELSLTAPGGEAVSLGTLDAADGRDVSGSYAVNAPLKWDSEHPNLYTLTATVRVGGEAVETASRQIGFRQIEVRGSEVFVNGDLLKLRGVNRHDIHPVTGRAITRELVEEDVRLFKEANINFIRTSHYPPRPDFLDLCDRFGIYVEDEIAVAFLGQGVDCRENDPAYTDCFLGQLSEMIERDRSHPSVLLWSLANECFWGENFALENAYCHQEDPTRPTIFSYPITQREDDDRADIWSMHYAAWDQSPIALVDSFDRSRHEDIPWPVLHDESTHIPCYDRADQRRDPAVRDFWGETIRMFWDRLWSTKGALGCAVWAGIDDVWMHSRRGYAGPPWGIIDGWRRRKPEFWHMRKAYSPIRLTGEPYARGGHTAVAVENRFNHTNLSEVTIGWRLGGRSGEMAGPDLPQRGRGEIVVPAACVPGEALELEFTDPFGNLVDEAYYPLAAPAPALPRLTGGAPDIAETADEVVVSGGGFALRFSKATGLITEGTVGGETVVTGGPHLHLTGLALGPWALDKLAHAAADGCAALRIEGKYGGKVAVAFDIRIDADGLMETTYTLTDMPYPSPRKLAMRIGDDTDSGGYEEVGLSFDLPAAMDTLSWERQGVWTVYPDWHIARLKGVAAKRGPTGGQAPDQRPDRDWQLDEADPVIFGKYDPGRLGTRDFRSMKPYIKRASLGRGASGAAFTALSDGGDSARAELTHNPAFIVDDRDPRLAYEGNWLRQDTRNRSLNGTETWSCAAGDSCTLDFEGTGCAWIGSVDILGGLAKVYLDGELVDGAVSLGVRLMTPGVARGYEKGYRRLLYSVDGLPAGRHTLRVEVAGERAAGSHGAYVFIDHFLIYTDGDEGDIRFIVDSEFNYPELSWGCYTKPPVRADTGYSRKIYTRLGKREE